MDITEKLRTGECAVDARGEPCSDMSARGGCICAMAADEIDRLRATLQTIADNNIGCIVQPGETSETANFRAARNIAREALERPR